ncbi:MAG: hypothetical protein K6F62_01880 [Schwartzia sp.]|nr:hypothetical protein [Schwartzia sp. (in: firmicutes)]
MSEKEQDFTEPHGEDQIIKMDILGMIHSAENPFDIIYHVARYLEKKTQENGYADQIRDNIRSVYGLAMGETKLLTDELHDVEQRLERIRHSYDTGEFTSEEKKRIEYAVKLHEKNIERLKLLIHQAEIDNTSMTFEKK